MPILLSFVFFFICLSAFFSASEAAFIASSEEKIYSLKNKSNAKLIDKFILFMREKEKIINIALLGNSVSSIVASSLSTLIFIEIFNETKLGIENNDFAALVSTIVMTIVVFIFGESIPKTLAINNPEKISLLFMNVFIILSKIMSPFLYLISILTNIFYKILRIKNQSSKASISVQEELKILIELKRKNNNSLFKEQEMLNAILSLDSVSVDQIMTHRSDVFAIDINDYKSVVKIISESPYSRIPVYEKSIDNIIGVLHVKDVFNLYYNTLSKNKNDSIQIDDLKKIMQKANFVPENTTLHKQLSIFLNTRVHMSFIVDEYGGTSGMTTFEDLIEEIVGDIRDEHDRSEESDMVLDESGNIFIHGDYTIRDFNKEFESSFEEDDEFSTIAGLIISKLERIPSVNEEIIIDDYQFIIIKKTKNKIDKIKAFKVNNNQNENMNNEDDVNLKSIDQSTTS